MKRAGADEHLGIDDLHGVRESCRIKNSEAIITREYERYNKKGLIKPMMIWFGRDYLLIALGNIIYCCFNYISPYLVYNIIKWIESDDTDMTNGLKWLGLLVLTQSLGYLMF